MPDLFDRVQETTTTGGTGTITLGGAVVGYRTFASAMSVGTVTYYVIDNGQNEWEIGAGTLVTSGTLSRDTVLESSNSNALVNFSSGTKRVFCSAPTKVLLPNETGNSGKLLTTDGVTPSWTTTLNGMTIGNVTPGSGAFTTLSASSTVSGTGFSTYLASPPAIGSTTPAAGSFTTLSTTGNVTLGDASADTVTFNAATVTLNNSTTISAASTKNLTLNGGAGSNGLVLDASNNVGIGAASSGGKFETAAVGGGIVLKQNATGADTYYVFDNTVETGGKRWRLGYTGAAGTSVGQFNIYNQTDNVLGWVLDSSGNLGLGVTPSAWNSRKALQITGPGSAITGSLYSGGGTTNGNGLVNNAYYDGTNWKFIYSGSSFQACSYELNSGGHYWYNSNNSGGTGGATWTPNQAMTLDASGNLLVGTTTPNARLYVTADTSTSAGNRVALFSSTYSSDNNNACVATVKASATNTNANIFQAFYINAGATTSGFITANGANAAGFSSSSDSSLKENITALPNQLANICALKPSEFDYKDGSGHQIGFIAQEMQEVYPDCVAEDGDGMLMISGWSKTEARLVKAIQEIAAELNELKQKVNA